jgi:hypothetical protein
VVVEVVVVVVVVEDEDRFPGKMRTIESINQWEVVGTPVL